MDKTIEIFNRNGTLVDAHVNSKYLYRYREKTFLYYNLQLFSICHLPCILLK